MTSTSADLTLVSGDDSISFWIHAAITSRAEALSPARESSGFFSRSARAATSSRRRANHSATPVCPFAVAWSRGDEPSFAGAAMSAPHA